MKTIYKTLVLCLMLLPLSVSAQNYIHEEGKIYSIDSKFINLGDSLIALLATTKVFLVNGKPGKLEQVKAGQYAEANLIKIDKKIFVDTLRLQEGPRSVERKTRSEER